MIKVTFFGLYFCFFINNEVMCHICVYHSIEIFSCTEITEHNVESVHIYGACTVKFYNVVLNSYINIMFCKNQIQKCENLQNK